MSIEANKTLVRDYLDALRQDKSPSNLDRFVSDEDLMHHIAMYDVALPGYWLEAEQIIAEGDLVNVRAKGHGVHQGPLGAIPPTGKEVNFALFITYRIVNGKIAEHWMLPDMLTILQQIGAIPVAS